MDKNKLTGDLRALAASTEKRSQAARLREVADDVESALSAGVRRTAVLEVLNAHGFDMTLKAFDAAMGRIRKKRGTSRRTRTMPSRPAASGEGEARTGTGRVTEYPSTDSMSLREIFSSQPDLDALARLAKESGKKK